MSQSLASIEVGTKVRIYADEETYDEGVVRLVGEVVEVDFYDWIEVWPSAEQFVQHQSFYENVAFLVPLVEGETIQVFQSGLEL